MKRILLVGLLIFGIGDIPNFKVVRVHADKREEGVTACMALPSALWKCLELLEAFPGVTYEVRPCVTGGDANA